MLKNLHGVVIQQNILVLAVPKRMFLYQIKIMRWIKPEKFLRHLLGLNRAHVAVQGTIDGRTTCRPRDWRFGTWNVGTLTGRGLEVVEELQRRIVDVAALQEIRWKGEGTRFVGAKGGRYKLWWKGDDGTGGVGVMVREELVEKVLEVRRRSNGVIVLVIVFGKVIVRVISGYAPQQSRKEEEKDRFYDDVSDEIGQAGDSWKLYKGKNCDTILIDIRAADGFRWGRNTCLAYPSEY
ncbi:hypothetical protein HELRODRAFT_182318 [Helobdella robusta]|uniref:Endonuclease/exonuclease/phosphatase domain-containing protein n=1 Tax=Helobdella robusta TaxID=6412 RepID=T1FI21_HELRO|nr:hypothetical protein HELRODRAFT_182318 [Helobdella robusta]ESN91067.1 hypothetical protein HELRODRAFT_182318 [Helobdella robusta]